MTAEYFPVTSCGFKKNSLGFIAMLINFFACGKRAKPRVNMR